MSEPQEPTDLAEIVTLIAEGFITPPMRGYAEAWLWHPRGEAQPDWGVDVLYSAAPAHAEAIARAIGSPGVLDVIYPDERSCEEHLVDWLADEGLTPRAALRQETDT